MSCNATYPPEATECPNCQVGLSLVRKCPSCERIQSAQHLTCIYCADSFLQEEGLGVLAAGPLKRRRREAEARLRKIAISAAALILVAGLAVFLYKRQAGVSTPPIARSFVTAADPISMRKAPSNDAPPIKSLQPSDKLSITECVYDSEGNRWFGVTSAGLNGFVKTEDVAPPEAIRADPEGGYTALRHWLLRLNDPATLDYAREAVEYYRNIFPSNPHADELRWLLAEQVRDLAERKGRSRNLLATAREQYEKLAASNGEYADRARQALGQFPTGAPSAEQRRSSAPTPLQFSVVGGSLSSSQPTPGAPVRKVTVLSRTPLVVSLTAPLQLAPGAQGEGEIAEDIRVKNDLAVPRGSHARLSVAASRISSGGALQPPSLSLRLTALVIDNQTYGVSARAVGDHLPGTLAAGTRVEFRLGTPLVVTQR